MDNLTKALLSVQQLKKAVKPLEKRTEQNRVVLKILICYEISLVSINILP